MGKLDDNQNSTVVGRVRSESKRVPFRRVLYAYPSPGFFAELRNPGLWNDAVVEMV